MKHLSIFTFFCSILLIITLIFATMTGGIYYVNGIHDSLSTLTTEQTLQVTKRQADTFEVFLEDDFDALSTFQNGLSLLKSDDTEYIDSMLDVLASMRFLSSLIQREKFFYVLLIIRNTHIEHTSWYFLSILPDSQVMKNADTMIAESKLFTTICQIGLIVFLAFVLLLYVSRHRTILKDQKLKDRDTLFGVLANQTNDVFVMLSSPDMIFSEKFLRAVPSPHREAVSTKKPEKRYGFLRPFIIMCRRIPNVILSVFLTGHRKKKTGMPWKMPWSLQSRQTRQKQIS